MTGNNVPQPADRVRAQQCLDRRLQGQTWQEIADAEGYADRSGARRAVERLLDRTGAELVEEYREVENARLDALQAAHWSAAIGGDIKSAELVLKVSAQRARLLGLNRPERVSIEATTSEDFATTAARLLAEIATAETEPAAVESAPWSNIGD
ncbi:hypothetical protein [Rhodococcus zopfii]|uniref:hypothetical protein n=1 Tax=Rhodococcus zopfii TaxID=43772 RepID=UPI00111102DA|nr:hypothetical protein [Rhodococcus zopfii]